MSHRCSAVLAVLAFLSATPALAVECTNPNPRESDLWRQFANFVSVEYLDGRSFEASFGNAEIIGHALGRAATAVQGDPDRQIAFACLELAIQQLTAAAVIMDVEGGANAQEKIIAASMGMYDKEVRKLTGVTDTSPADSVYAGLVPGSLTSVQDKDQDKGTEKSLDQVVDSQVSSSVEAGIDRPGGDYFSFDLDRAEPSLCLNACAENEQCLAWTYVKPGVQGDLARCWLKDVVPTDIADACCTSGVMERSGTDDVVTGNGADADSGAAHPWDTVRPDGRWCAGDIIDAGYKPIFAQLSAIWENTYVFADPVDNTYIAIAGCNPSPWDWVAFEQDWKEEATTYPTYEEDPTYFKKVAYRHKDSGDRTTISYFR